MEKDFLHPCRESKDVDYQLKRVFCTRNTQVSLLSKLLIGGFQQISLLHKTKQNLGASGPIPSFSTTWLSFTGFTREAPKWIYHPPKGFGEGIRPVVMIIPQTKSIESNGYSFTVFMETCRHLGLCSLVESFRDKN